MIERKVLLNYLFYLYYITLGVEIFLKAISDHFNYT